MKNCLNCSKKTSNNKFCSRSCAASFNNKGINRHGTEITTRICLECGKETSNPKFCSNKCQGHYKIITNRKDMFNGKNGSWKVIKSYLKETVGKCQECGISEWNNKSLSLECDHIDGDGTNNTLENARLLCPNCHSQTSTYKFRNSVNPKGKLHRRLRYHKNQKKLVNPPGFEPGIKL